MIRRFRTGSLAAALLLFTQAVSASEPPFVQLVSATPWAGDGTTVSYVVFDPDDDVAGELTFALYAYPDPNLRSTEDVRLFAIMIADDRDLDPEIGTGDFAESEGNADVQDYTWDDPGSTLRSRGFAPAPAIFPGRYFLYLVARDGDNEPSMAVSDFAVTVTPSSTAVDPLTWGRLKADR